jgi:hypothetical protein
MQCGPGSYGLLALYLPLFTNLVELDFRWDEKADPRAVPCARVCKFMRAP